MIFLLILSWLAVIEANLLVGKELSCRWVAVGEECVLHHLLYNAGDYDLKGIEFLLDPDLVLRSHADVEGICDVKVFKLAPKTSFRHSILVVPRPSALESDAFTSVIRTPTIVKYLDGSKIISSSSSIPATFHIASAKQHSYWIGNRSVIWINFATIVMAPTVMALYLRYRIDVRYPIHKKR